MMGAEQDKVIHDIGELGMTSLPRKAKKVKSTAKDRAMEIIDQHKKRLETKEMVVMAVTGENEYGIMSLVRTEWSKVTREWDPIKQIWTYKCDCRSFRFQTGTDPDTEECKHILSVKFAEEQNITIPKLDDIMETLGTDIEAGEPNGDQSSAN